MENSSYKGSVPPSGRLFGRQRPIYDVLGGGKVAEVALWRDKRVSGAILLGIATIWFLFEVVEYTLVTLLCHLTITTMLLTVIWSTAAKFFNWNRDPLFLAIRTLFADSSRRNVDSTFQTIFNELLLMILLVAGDHPILFLLTILSLWIISIIGSWISGLTLLFFGTLCLLTFPFLYEQYEDEVDNLAYKLNTMMKEMYTKFEAKILGKIPMGPVKDKNN